MGLIHYKCNHCTIKDEMLKLLEMCMFSKAQVLGNIHNHTHPISNVKIKQIYNTESIFSFLILTV